MSDRRTLAHWLLGVAIGAIVGVGLFLGPAGFVLALPVVVWVIVDRPRGMALGGVVIGLGVTWFVVWTRLALTCSGPETTSDGCVGPDVRHLIVVSIILILVGALASSIAIRRYGRTHVRPRD